MVLLEIILIGGAIKFRKEIKKFGKDIGIDFDRLRPTKKDLKDLKNRFDRIGGL